MADWFVELTDTICRTIGLTERPNSCNANYYDDGAQSVGWHSDDEPLFDALKRDVLILSLSLGATRIFELASKDKPLEITKLPLEEIQCLQPAEDEHRRSLCQKHYRHRVPRQRAPTGPRINLTWRWLLRHERHCPMAVGGSAGSSSAASS